MEEVFQAPQVPAGGGSETMLATQEGQRMLALQALGWGAKRISREVGCSRNTVREYLRRGGWRPMDVAARAGVLEPHREWLAERLRRHRGNADVVRQDLARELGIEVSLRTIQRAVEPLRRELRAQAVATVAGARVASTAVKAVKATAVAMAARTATVGDSVGLERWR